jgi:hypothetical protein
MFGSGGLDAKLAALAGTLTELSSIRQYNTTVRTLTKLSSIYRQNSDGIWTLTELSDP